MNNKKFFSDDVSEPVQVMVVNGDALQEPRIECCFNLEQLDAVLKHQVSQEKTFTFISICQKNSWRPLQITESMFNAIVSHYELNDCAHELVSCFYGRKEDIEETYCETLSHLRSDASSDISYTFRYPEFKAQNNRWSLRQSGVYHRVQHDTGHHVIILLSPSPKSAASQRISDKLSDVSLSKLGKDGLWVHSLLFSTYIPSWRQYIYHLQEQLLPATNSALAADIDRKMHVTYEDLNALYRLINTLVKLPAMIVQSSDVLQGLLKQNPQGDSSQTSVQQIANLERRTVGYSRMASCLHQQAQASAQLLSDTLSLRDQTIGKSVSQSTYRITIMGLIYLPTTFVGTVFGTNFFGYNSDKQGIEGARNIWIFFIASGLLTLFTFLVYHGVWGWDLGPITRNARGATTGNVPATRIGSAPATTTGNSISKRLRRLLALRRRKAKDHQLSSLGV